MEPTLHTPSVIARLMGLDELPTHQPIQKKRRVLSEDYLQRVASIGVREKRSSDACPSFRFGIEEKKEFEDAYNSLEKFKRRKDCNLSVKKGDVNLSLSKVQMALLSRSIGDAKPVSVDKESQMSNEGHGELGVVGSKMDIFIKYLQEPDSSSFKHLYDLQGIRHRSQSRKITVLKSSHASDFAKTDRCVKCGRGTDQGSDELNPKLQTGLLAHSHGKLGLGKIQQFLRSQTKSDNRAHLPSTKIVVLKPKPGKTDHAGRYFLSSSSHGDSHSINKQHKGSYSPENGNSFAQAIKTKNVAKYVKSVRRRSRFSKENCVEESELDSVERQKTNKRFQEVGVTSEGRSLGEVLATPDHESRHRNLDAKLGEDGCSSQIGFCSDGLMRLSESANWLQHKSRKQIHNNKNGTELQHELKRKLEEKDQCQQTSLVFNPSSYGGLSTDSEHGSCVQENKSVHREQIMREEKDPSEENSVETSLSATSFAPTTMVTDLETCAENEDVGVTSENHKEHHFKPIDCTLLHKADDVSSSVPNTATQQDLSIGMSEEDSVSSFCSCTDPESFVYSEETCQPSPISVLEPPFEREISCGSECFRGVNASLHGLQLQLELLKSESEEYPEGTGMIVSSDDDSEEGSMRNHEENEKSMKIFNVEESRDYSYLVDVFTEAGFHGRNLDTVYNTGHAPECPISYVVFERLEKKYGEQMCWKRSDRRLLFDLINSELTELLQPSIGIHWTKPVCRRLSYRKSPEGIKEDIWISLVSRETLAKNDSNQKLLMGNDDGWSDLGDEMDGIVKEIEDSLIDELATEVVSMESF